MEHESGVTRRRGWNDFGRKDLFVQHGRRMHCQEVYEVGREGMSAGIGRVEEKGAIEGKGASRGYEALSREKKGSWEAAMELVRERCWVRRREAPVGVSCGVEGCRERKRWGWEERMEHVAGHWEKGERSGEGVDEVLLEWCVREGIVVEDGGRWVLTGLKTHEVQGKKAGARRGLRSQEEDIVKVEEVVGDGGNEVEDEEDAAFEVE